MIFILIFISVLAFAFSCCIACGEMAAERDWPRDTGKYPLIFAATTMMLILAV